MLSIQEIRQLGEREWHDELQKARVELMKVSFNLKSGTAKDTHMQKGLKKYIAQLMTVRNEQNMEVKKSSPAPMKKKEEKPAMKEEMKMEEPKAPKAKAPKAAKKTTKKTAAKKTTKK